MTLLRRAAAALALLAAAPAWGQEEFGRFQGPPRGEFVQTTPCAFFRLAAALTFEAPGGEGWTAPAEAVVNGADIPQIAYWLVGRPFDPDLFPASVIHDRYAMTRERPAADTHWAFYLGLRAGGVPESRASLILWTVSLARPDWPVGQANDAPLVCNRRLDGAVFRSSRPARPAVPATEVDFSDAAQAAAALSKMAAILITLETTGGEILDVLSTGPVPADPESVAAHAALLRALIANAGRAEVGTLGLAASWQGIDPGAPPTWAGGLPDHDALPAFADLPDPGAPPGEAPFLLRAQDLPLIAEALGVAEVPLLGPVPPPDAAVPPPAAAPPP